MTTLLEAISAYRTIAGADGKSPDTIAWVCDSARYFIEFLKEDPELGSIATADLRRWISALRQRKKLANHPHARSDKLLSSTSINNYVRGVKLLFSTLVKEEIIPEHPIVRFRPPKPLQRTIRPLTQTQLKAVFNSLDEGRNPLRNRAMVALLWDCCLRLSEVSGLLDEDVDLTEREIKVMGKGQKERVLPVSPWAAKQLLFYRLKERPETEVEAFFVNDQGQATTAKALQQVLRRVSRKLGIRCNPHTFRHTGALTLVRNGLDSLRLQRMLGHTDLTMTKRYVLLGDGDLKKSHEQYSPASKFRP